jgi:hypothetical protein
MVKLELIDPKLREGLICARCGETRSVKYLRNGFTYCNRCAILHSFVDDTVEGEEDVQDLG